ncbi:MAG: hypothetical protein RIC87_02635 [Kiloniellales bacterium]
MLRTTALVFAGLVLTTAGYAETISTDAIAKATVAVDKDMIIANAKDGRNGLTYGLDFAETRYAKLKQIDAANVERLGLAWSTSIGSKRGYISAYDAETGAQAWRWYALPGVTNGGNIPNPGYCSHEMVADLTNVVLSDALESEGMPNVTGKLSPEEVGLMAALVQDSADAVRPKE